MSEKGWRAAHKTAHAVTVVAFVVAVVGLVVLIGQLMERIG